MVHEVMMLDIIDGKAGFAGRAIIRVRRQDGKHAQVDIDSRVVLHEAPKCQFGQIMLHALFAGGQLLTEDRATR